MWRQFYLAIALIFIFGLSACADSRPETFLEKFKAMESDLDLLLHSAWYRSSKSPFAPYVQKDFTQGLTKHQMALYQTALDNKDCKVIGDLERKGFFGFYPHLRPLFEQDKTSGVKHENILNVFNGVILYFHSLGFRYCSAHQKIKEASNLAEQYGFILPPLNLKEPNAIYPSNLLKDSKEMHALRKRCSGINGLIFLSIFAEYKRAILDVLNFIDQADGIILPPDIELYLRTIADQLKIKQKKRKYHHQKLISVLSAQDIEDIGSMAEEHFPNISWFRGSLCGIRK